MSRVSGLSEIVWWILGYGDQAEVFGRRSSGNWSPNECKNLPQLYGVDGGPTPARAWE